MKRLIVFVTATMLWPGVAAWSQQILPNVQYVSGRTDLPRESNGSLVLTASQLRFNDNKGDSVMVLPLSTIKSVTSWEDLLYVNTKTTDVSELLVFKCEDKTSQSMMASIQLQMRKAAMTSAPVTQAAPADSASRDSAMANGASEVVIGARVRITTATGKLSSWDQLLGRKPRLAGTVIAVDRDSLVIQPEGEESRPVTYSSSFIERWELSQGRRPGRLKGGVYGAAAGAGTVAAILLMAELANAESPPEKQRPPSTSQDFTRWTLLGGLIGGVVGSLAYKEEAWTGVAFAWGEHSTVIRGEFGAAPLRSPGMIMFVRLSFQMRPRTSHPALL